ncbi:CG7352 [Drosophila busckii]|uniref:Meiosis-specific nuclear structural protein 1 n=1 Tax=Drosophila busckii TaxID=30019 RepID=A0A0M3QXU9_DROBS|nr:trichohyalin [Drosophila busckii]ALC46553.1 CG7352 [Drosophila busckii]
MTTAARILMDKRDATPPILISGRPTTLVIVDDDLVYKEKRFFCDVLFEMQQRNADLSKENPLRKQEVISEELRQLKRKEYLDSQRRRQLRNECSELRELGEQLRLAAITKELDEQLQEKYKDRQLAKNAKALGYQRALVERQEQLAKELEQEQGKKAQQQRLHDTLSKQIEEKKRQREQQCVLTMADREEREALQRQIEQEDRQQKLEVLLAKDRKRIEMLKRIEEDRANKALLKTESSEDMTKAMLRQAHIDEEKRRLEDEQKETQRKHQEISMRIGQKVLETENHKRQREKLLLELLTAEYRAKSDEQYRQQLQQEEEKRRRTKQELEQYRAELWQRQQEETRLKLQQTAQRHTDDTSEQEQLEKEMLEQQRRRQHGALLLSMIEDNRRKRAEAAAENVQFFDMKAKSEAEQQAIIQEERLKLLGSVPAAVLKYLPNQVLSKTDREHFNMQTKVSSDSLVKHKFQ